MQHNGRVRRSHAWFGIRGVGLLVALTLFAAQAVLVHHGVRGQSATGQETVLDVKFRSGQIRVRNGVPVDQSGASLIDPQTSALLARIGRWERTHRVTEQDLERLRDRAVRASGQQMPDLNLYFRVTLPAGADTDQAIRELQQVPNIEAAYLAPRPAPLPVAPDFFALPTGSDAPYQRYLDAAPGGIGVRAVRDLKGANAAGITICDVEYSWNANHTDLPTITLYGLEPDDPFNSDDHGTAVLGVLGSKNNGNGSTGIADGADLAFIAANTELGGYNVGAAIIECANNLKAGDVLLIEQQIYGPNSSGFGCNGCVPVEWYKPTYDAIKVAVASGIVVVEAAANGGQNLDAPIYRTGNNGHYPFLAANDSGALIVGAGRSPTHGTNARAAHSFSGYGSTVDLQGWGDSVLTSGYGDLYSAEGKNSWYTGTFNGTSSASPVVAGAVAVLQGVHKTRFGTVASPAKVRSLLRATGTPQTGSNTIGPLPNLQCAVDSVLPLTITTPDSVLIGSSAPLTATIAAVDVTLPVTYTWKIDGSTPITVSGDTTNLFRPLWNTRGSHTVRVEARSGCGLPVSATAMVEVTGVAPGSATIDGATRPVLGATTSYTATLAPITTSQPVTYTWQIDEQPPVTHTAGISDSRSLTWNSVGTHILTTTIDNGWGAPVIISKEVEVGVPVGATSMITSGEALVGGTTIYTITVDSVGASLPISYTWQLDDTPPVSDAGDSSFTFEVRWTRAGDHNLKLMVSNGWGAPFVVEQQVNVGKQRFQVYLPLLKAS